MKKVTLMVLLVALLVGLLGACTVKPTTTTTKAEDKVTQTEAPTATEADEEKEEATDPVEETYADAEAPSAEEPIKVGLIGPLTGAVSVYGIAATNGSQLAFEEINAAGGILGRPVEFILLDEKGDPTEAVNAYRRLVENDKIDVLIGDVTSKPSLAVAQEAAKINLPMITPTGTAENVTEAGTNVFRTCFLDSAQGVAMADFAANSLELKKVGVIYNASSDYSEGLKDAFVARAQEHGIEIIEPEAYNDGDVNFNVQLTKIAQDEPDGLYVPDYYDVDLQIITQARLAGIDGPVMGADGWDGVLDVAGDNPQDADGAYYTNHYAADAPDEALQAFLQSYRETYDMEANSFAALGYDSAYIVKEALERAGNTDRQAVVDALAATDIQGITGAIRFDEKRNPVKPIWIIKVEDGAYKFVEQVDLEASGGSGSSSSEAQPVKIGLLGPLTGGVSIYGIAATNGSILALDEINEAGGILGRPVEYVLLDEKGDPTEAVNAYRRLVENDKIDVLIGDVTSKPSLAVAQEAAKINLPMITPTGTAENVTEAGENVFRTCFIDSAQGVAMADFAANSLGLQKVGVIYNASSDYSEGLKDAFVERATELGLEVIEPEAYNDGDVNFNVQLTKIAQARPEGLFVPDYYDVDLQIIIQARLAGIDGPVMGADGWDGVLDVTGDNPEDADGAYYTNHYAADAPDEKLQTFLEAYRVTYDMEANAFAALGYDSVYIVKEALERAGSTDRQAVVDALAATDIQGVTGAIRFDEKRNPVKTIWIIKVQDGAYQYADKVELGGDVDDTAETESE